MLDLELLRSFVSVVDAGGFTRAGERVHRTQSTVSQQIKRLEDDVGQPLLNRNGKDVTPTEAGERLLSYARRLLALAEEARDVVARPESEGAVAARRARGFCRLSAGETAGGVLALASRPAARRPRRSERQPASAISNAANSIWRCSSAPPAKRRHRGVAGARALGHQQEPSARYAHRLGAADRLSHRLPRIARARSMRWKAPDAAWHMAYTSSNLAGIQAAVAAGMGSDHSLGNRDPGRSSRAGGEGWLCADRPDRSGAGGLARCQPGDAAAGGSAGASSAARCSERRASSPARMHRGSGKGSSCAVPTIQRRCSANGGHADALPTLRRAARCRRAAQFSITPRRGDGVHAVVAEHVSHEAGRAEQILQRPRRGCSGRRYRRRTRASRRARRRLAKQRRSIDAAARRRRAPWDADGRRFRPIAPCRLMAERDRGRSRLRSRPRRRDRTAAPDRDCPISRSSRAVPASP